MFARLSRSWDLVKASASVLQQDKELLLFPAVSVAALAVLVACFALPVVGFGMLDGLRGRSEDGISAAAYAIAFLFYFSQYFIIFFFNTALVGAAMIRLDGGNPTLGDGVRVAKSKLGTIAGCALIAATVGMILRAIQERVGFIGRIVVALLGVGWTVATFLVVPVLAARDVGPVEAIKQSAGLMKDTWGENVMGQVGLGAAFGFIFLGVIVCGAILVAGAIAAGSVFLIVVALGATVLAIAITGLVQSALTGIYAAALYRYAVTGKGTAGFEAEAMQLAFVPKK